MKNSITVRFLVALFTLLFSVCFTSTIYAQSSASSSVEENYNGNGNGYNEYDDCMLTNSCGGSSGNSFEGKEGDLLPSIRLSPNPAVGNLMKVWFNQLAGTSRLSVIDLSGKLIHQASIGNEQEKEGMYEINTSQLTPGVYIVHLTSGIYKSVKKVVVR